MTEKISREEFLKLLDKLKHFPKKCFGTYLIDGIRIQISKYKAEQKERQALSYRKRTEKGLCGNCGSIVYEINPRTGNKYKRCSICRAKDRNRLSKDIRLKL